jgi:hypothetical protein
MKNGFSRHIRVKRVLLHFFAALFAALLLSAALIASIPTLVSAPTVQRHLRQTLAKSLLRTVDWSSLSMTWSKGLTIAGFSLGKGPAPLLSATVAEVAVVPTVSLGEERRLRLDLTLRVRGVDASLAPGPPKPPKPYEEPFTLLARMVQQFERLDWPLPIDLGARVELLPSHLAYRDPATGKRLEVNGLGVRFDMPSLADRPIATEVSGELAVDGHRPEPLRLKGRIERLVTQRRLRPASGLITLDASLPGGTLTLSGGVREPDGFAARGRLDLPQLLASLRPLLPPATPAVTGEVALDLRARMTSGRDLRGVLDVTAAGLAASGGRLKGRIGPLDVRLHQGIASDRERRTVTFGEGSLRVSGLLEAAWRASVERPDRPDRTLAAELGPVRLDLRRGLVVAGPFLPPTLPVRELEGVLTLRRVTLHLNGRTKAGDVAVEGAGVSLPRVRLALAQGPVTAEGVELVIDRAAVPLVALKPTRVDADLSYAVAGATVAGARPVRAEGVRGRLRLAVRDLDLGTASPRRFAASAEVTQNLDLGRCIVEKTVSVAGLHEEVRLLARAGATGEITATLPELRVTAETVKAVASGRQLAPFPLAAVLTATGIRLPAAKGARPSLERASLTLSSGDLLRLSARAGLSYATPQTATTDGTARLDLDRLLPLAAPFLPKGVTAGGNASLSWDLAAPLESRTLSKEENPLRLARAAAGMIDRGEVALALDAKGITVPLKDGKISLGSLRTSRPVHLRLTGKGGSISLDAGVEFDALAGLPGTAGKLSPQRGSLSVTGDIADWKSVRLKEELRLTTLDLSQTAEAAIGRLDPLLEEKGKLTPATLLKHLDADLSARLAARLPDRPVTLPGGLEFSGASIATIRANLTAGNALRLRARVETRDFGARVGNGTTVEGVNADILIDRTYALAKSAGESWTPLSVGLVRPAPEERSGAGAAELAGRVREDLRGQESGSRRFTIRRIAAKGGDIPVELTNLEGELLLEPQQVGLNFFQTELLGGTLRTRGIIDLRPERPVFSAACSFSNLDVTLLLPPEKRTGRQGSEATEMSGELTLDAPLATGERELVEGVRMRLNIHRIGPDTLERALFSLDPYERNEQLVAQRQLLRHGTLKRLSAQTLDGAFSLEGEVRVKGIDIDLPRVERIRVAELATRKQLAGAVAAVGSLRKVLELVRADKLVVGPKGEISLVRSGKKSVD